MKIRLRRLMPICIGLFMLHLHPACAPRVCVGPTPPPPRKEVRTVKPFKKAVWIPGHWKWRNRRKGYVWVPGHWKRVR